MGIITFHPFDPNILKVRVPIFSRTALFLPFSFFFRLNKEKENKRTRRKKGAQKKRLECENRCPTSTTLSYIQSGRQTPVKATRASLIILLEI